MRLTRAYLTMDLKTPTDPTSYPSKPHDRDNTYSFSKNDHQLRELVRKEGKHCRKGT